MEKILLETKNKIYKFYFREVQFEITGVCNMKCKHCRGSEDEYIDLKLEDIKNTLLFVRKYSPEYKEVVITGGEPLMHGDFEGVIHLLEEFETQKLTLTTNGTYLNNEILDLLDKSKIERISFSISLDFIDKEAHNEFRQCRTAYDDALKSISKIIAFNSKKFEVSMRATILPNSIKNMEKYVEFAMKLGTDSISFSTVLPAGKAIENTDLWMNKEQFNSFIENLAILEEKYKGRIYVISNEILKWQKVERNLYDGTSKKNYVCSCPAGTLALNINSNGDVTPCSMLNIPMFNILNKSAKDIEQLFLNSKIVQNLFDKDLTGKCSECAHKIACSGCRARAYILTGNYLGEDPMCSNGPYHE